MVEQAVERGGDALSPAFARGCLLARVRILPDPWRVWFRNERREKVAGKRAPRGPPFPGACYDASVPAPRTEEDDPRLASFFVHCLLYADFNHPVVCA